MPKEETMQAGKLENKSRLRGWLRVVLYVVALICVATVIVGLFIATLRSGLNWGQPWITGFRDGVKVGLFTFLSALGFMVLIGMWTLAHMLQRPTAERWGVASNLMFLVYMGSHVAADQRLDIPTRAFTAFVFGTAIILRGIILWRDWRASGNLADTQNGNSDGG